MDILHSTRTQGKFKLSDADYHADPAISSTQLVKALRSPAHFWHSASMNPKRAKDADTDALEFGRAIHCYILERDVFEQTYIVLPEDAPKRPTKRQVEAAKPSPSTLEAICWWEEFDAVVAERGAAVISQDDRATIVAMAEALSAQEIESDSGAVAALSSLFSKGEGEMAYFWRDEPTGLMCRCKVDWLIGNTVLDYKSTRDAQLHAFRRQVGNLHYHMRAAFYLDGVEIVTGKRPTQYILLAQEKEAPYCAAPYKLLDVDIEQGRAEYRRALDRIAASVKQVRFDGYSRKVVELSIPDYMYNQ
jgi:hypothetical protein